MVSWTGTSSNRWADGLAEMVVDSSKICGKLVGMNWWSSQSRMKRNGKSNRRI